MNGLTKIEKEIKYNKMQFNDKLEDIHTHIESRLIELIGTLGKKLHTARSRNDQVATDTKIWLREQNKLIDKYLKKLHVILADDSELVGVDAFIYVWRRTQGYNWLAKLTSLPVIKQIARFIYSILAFLIYWRFKIFIKS